MALNDHNPNRQYTKYKRHVNESLERVDAETVNKLQDDINVHQLESNKIKDKAFEERVYTIFNNNLYVNAMFIDYFRTGEFVNLYASTSSVAIDSQYNQLTLKQGSPSGDAVSTVIHSIHGPEVELNDFFLITSEDIPVGASIKYLLELSTGERYPISPNQLKTPMHLHKNITNGVKLVISMKANSLGEKPKLNGYAILYWDAQVEEGYGFTNPELQRFPKVEVGEDDGLVTLIRDRAQQDKLVKVLEPLDTVELTYDWKMNDGRLGFVQTHWPNYDDIEVTQIHKLIYGDYINSEGNTESVLQQIRQATTGRYRNVQEGDVNTCPECGCEEGFHEFPTDPEYANLLEELKNMKQQNMEGSDS